MYNLEKVNELLNKVNGDFSLFYNMFKEKIETEYKEEKCVDFFPEFMFFEERYLMIKKHLLENSKKGNIYDIGCQFGFQSEFFSDNKNYNYHGIDVYNDNFFNKDKENVFYHVGNFPKQLTLKDLNFKQNDIVLSIMSLGYFNNFIDENEEVALDMIVKALKEVRTLYITTTPELANKLVLWFDKYEIIEDTLSDNKSNNYKTYYFKKNHPFSHYPLIRLNTFGRTNKNEGHEKAIESFKEMKKTIK